MERRRHAPVPEGWESLAESALCALLAASVPVVRARFRAVDALPPGAA